MTLDIYTQLVNATQSDNYLSMEEFNEISPTSIAGDKDVVEDVQRFIVTASENSPWVVDRKILRMILENRDIYTPVIDYFPSIESLLHRVATRKVNLPPDDFEQFSPLVRDQIVFVDYHETSGGLYAMKYEMSQALYEKLIGNNPTVARCQNVHPDYVGSDLPVVCVTEIEAQQACSKIGDGFRLPSEEEWLLLADVPIWNDETFEDQNRLGGFPAFNGLAAVTSGHPNMHGLYNAGSSGTRPYENLTTTKGNAVEWTDPDITQAEDREDIAVVRSGLFGRGLSASGVYSSQDGSVGFRCVKEK